MSSIELIFHIAAEVMEHRRSLAEQLHTIICVHEANPTKEPELAVRIVAVYRADIECDPQVRTHSAGDTDRLRPSPTSTRSMAAKLSSLGTRRLFTASSSSMSRRTSAMRCKCPWRLVVLTVIAV